MVDYQDEQLDERIAEFLIQALSLDEEPATLAAELTPLKRDVNAGISTIELASSVGDVAFLVYHYVLQRQNDNGETGEELFNTGLATLTDAVTRDTPGPRLIASATTDTEAYILATTPAAHRALTGQNTDDQPAVIEATPSDLPLTIDRDKTRRSSANELLRLLQEANSQAETWLKAAGPQDASGENNVTSALNEEETALTLYLLDERSIQPLLQTLNRFINTARQSSANALGGDHMN